MIEQGELREKRGTEKQHLRRCFCLGNWVDDGPLLEIGNKGGVGVRRQKVHLFLDMLEFP